MSHRSSAFALLSCSLLAYSTAWAEDTEPAPEPELPISSESAANADVDAPTIPTFSWHQDSAVAARLNPLGLQLFARVGARWRLTDSTSRLMKDTFFSIGPTVTATPAFAQGGLSLMIQPINLFRFQVKVEAVGMFGVGAFDSTRSWADNTTAVWSDTAMAAQQDFKDVGGGAYASYGIRSTAEGRFQMKLGPIAARSTFQAVHQMVDLREGDTVFYDTILDILVPGHGFVFANDADLLGLIGDNFILGARHTWTHSPKDEAGTPLTTQRVGPLLIGKFVNKPDQPFGVVQGVLMAQWWVQHPYRTGQDVSQAFPYITLAVTTSGWWRKSKPQVAEASNAQSDNPAM